MKKAKFNYKKEDGTVSERTVINPTFLKESTNSLKDFTKTEVKYLNGFEIVGENMTTEQIKAYENIIEEYYSDIFMTLQEYVESKGLDPKKIIQKSFKKDGIQNLNVIE